MSENIQLILINTNADLCVLLEHLAGKCPIPEAPCVILDITKPFGRLEPTIRRPIADAIDPAGKLWFCIEKEGLSEYIPYCKPDKSPVKEILHLPDTVLWDVLRMLVHEPDVLLTEGSSQTIINPSNDNLAGTITNHDVFMENKVTLVLRGSDTEVTFVRRAEENATWKIISTISAIGS
mgnify:CR=1 FL=1